MQLTEGQSTQKVLHVDHKKSFEKEAEIQAEKAAEYKPGVQPGVIQQWKREGAGIWSKFHGLRQIQIQTYNLLRDMMNKGDSAKDKVRAVSSTSQLVEMADWIEDDEFLLAYKEGKTELPSRHTVWQLVEEQTAAKYLLQCIEKEIGDKKNKARKEDRVKQQEEEKERAERRKEREKSPARGGERRDRDRDRDSGNHRRDDDRRRDDRRDDRRDSGRDDRRR